MNEKGYEENVVVLVAFKMTNKASPTYILAKHIYTRIKQKFSLLNEKVFKCHLKVVGSIS